MLNSGLAASAVKTAIDDVFYGENDYESQPGIALATNSLVFKQATTSKAAEITEEYSGVGAFEAHVEEEAIKEATVRIGNQKTHSVVNYKRAVKIPVEFFEDDMHSVVNQTIEKFGMRARTTRDKQALSVYNLGFSTATTSDGVALFSNSHVALGSGNTVDNLETAALAPAALESIHKSLLEQEAQDGDLGGHVPAFLMVPPQLFPDALEFTKSELKANTTDNNLNYWSLIYPGMRVLQSPYVGAAYNGGSDTAYFMGSRNHSVTRFVRKGLTTDLVGPQTDDQDRYTYKARFREVVSAVSWEGIVASNGTT